MLNGFATVFALLAIVALPPYAEAQVGDLVAQGRQALAADRIDDAIALFEKAVAADAKDPAALAELGGAQVRKAPKVPLFKRPGWVQKGFRTLDEAADLFPHAYIVYVVRGIAAASVPDLFNKTPVAVKDLTTVVAMKDKTPAAVPDSVMGNVFLNLGRAYKKGGQIAEARATWERAKKAYPAAPEAPAIDKELKSL